MSEQSEASWERAALGLALLRTDPVGLGGAVIRMRAGPDRAQVLAALDPLRARKLHPGVSDEQLFGGIDLGATLNSGHAVETKGVLLNSEVLMLTMAERCPADLSAKLAQHLDAHPSSTLVALDEGAEPDEALPAALSDRLALYIAPEGRKPEDWAVPVGTPRVAVNQVYATQNDIEALTALAYTFGIDSLRAPALALRVARGCASLAGRDALTQDDINHAATLVYPQRATCVPDIPQDSADPPEPPPEPDTTEEPEDGAVSETIPDADMLVAAVKALLPPDLLAGLVPTGTTRSAAGSGKGQRRKSNRKGRPLPARPGHPDGRARIDLVATLRVAAPWQAVRKRARPDRSGVIVHPADIRLRRFQEHSDRLLIFAVDASGSSAIARLNEAKGAVEMLLGQAYAARDHVALIAFRGTGAELLLPPTRSLVQTKRRLAGLPGGGGTPLAAGLEQAMELADQSVRRGLSPTIVLLTDGRANIALDGSANRALAREDANRLARSLRAAGFAALVIDTAARPTGSLKELAGMIGAPYIEMPRADAARLSGAVSQALGT